MIESTVEELARRLRERRSRSCWARRSEMTAAAVTFDYWDTIVAEGARVEPGVARCVACRSTASRRPSMRTATPAADAIIGAFDENWERFEARWVANTGQYTPADTVDYVAGRLGLPLDGDLRPAPIDGFREVGERIPLDLAPGIAETHRVAARRRPAHRHRLRRRPHARADAPGAARVVRPAARFDAWAFSDETGWFKPAPEAFRPRSTAWASTTCGAAHVGDNPRTDVAGALGLGMVAVRYTGSARRDLAGRLDRGGTVPSRARSGLGRSRPGRATVPRGRSRDRRSPRAAGAARHRLSDAFHDPAPASVVRVMIRARDRVMGETTVTAAAAVAAVPAVPRGAPGDRLPVPHRGRRSPRGGRRLPGDVPGGAASLSAGA